MAAIPFALEFSALLPARLAILMYSMGTKVARRLAPSRKHVLHLDAGFNCFGYIFGICFSLLR